MQRASAVASVDGQPLLDRLLVGDLLDEARIRMLARIGGVDALHPVLRHRIVSAWISSARRAAAVSVEKNGLPVPAAKITIRPFSRWRIARRRM